jgi:hypothetical protein
LVFVNRALNVLVALELQDRGQRGLRGTVQLDVGGSAQALPFVERIVFVTINLEGSWTKRYMGGLQRSIIVFLALLRPNLW